MGLLEKLQEKNPELFNQRRKHYYFVDLASNNPVTLSNTLHLEQNGWEGLCIEGNPDYWYLLSQKRTCHIVGAFVGGTPDKDGTEVEVAIPSHDEGGVYGGIIGKKLDNKPNSKTTQKYKKDKRHLVSISTVFRQAGTPSMIDYFSLDVEGAESLVMADFPWKEYQFRFLTIERPKNDLRQTLEKQGYQLVTKLSGFGETLWMHNSNDLTIEEAKNIALSKKTKC